ncbi:MAG: serine/threonine protein kinase [Verrucomicrobiaceae bacterium]|nr:serine/threonine protein kinase [Verrucomicrobiaceae bacterium]
MLAASEHCQTLGTTQFCPPPAEGMGECGGVVLASEDAWGVMFGSFAGYQLLKVIARGGMGIVYHAREMETGEEVALKVLPGGQLLTREARWRFAAEARTMALLRHPGILPVYGRGEVNGTPYFSMKLANGGSLAERKSRYAGEWQQIAELMAQIADVVQFAHDSGVVHRDLKPSNIVFDEDDHPYVCDFGIAKRLNERGQLTGTCTQLGTPSYMSPELVRISGQGPSAASDVWSLGVILYELLAGKRPFVGDSPAQIMRHVEEDLPPPLRQVPRALAIIATTALSKRPADRYASAASMAADLRRWLSAKPICARAPKLTQIAWPWLRQHGMAATFLMLVTSICLSGWGIVSRVNAKWNQVAGLQREKSDALVRHERPTPSPNPKRRVPREVTHAKHKPHGPITSGNPETR